MTGRRNAVFVRTAVVVCGALLCGAVILALAGYDVPAAALAGWKGAFGGPFPILSATLKRATPFIVLGIAVAAAFRAGVLNIGADGQFLAGATAAVAVGLVARDLPAVVLLPAECAAAVLGGAAWAGVAAVLKLRFRVSEVVSTLLLNFVALYVVGFLVRGPLQEPSHAYPQTLALGDNARLPLLVPGHQLHWGFVIAVGVAVAAWWHFDRSAAGFRARVAGASPDAARSAGLIPVDRVQAGALVLSGAVAGVAGFSEVTGVTYALYENLSPGFGYTAIAVALLGGLRPIGVLAAAVMFGALGAASDAMQRDANVPAELAQVVAALVILGVIVMPRVRPLAREVAGAGT